MAKGKQQIRKERISISEIVGDAVLKSGETQSAYRALRQLICSRCCSIIKTGGYFTRTHLPGIPMPISPRCQECVPFELRLFDEKETSTKKEKSELLSSLLEGDKPVPQHQAAKEKEDVEEKFLSRLGPALEKTKRKQNQKR
jgi:hypothetical protein